MNRSLRPWNRVSLFAVFAAAICATTTANATLVAQWTFDGTGDAFVADSSGNGNNLGNWQVAQSGNTPTGVGSSAYFDGTAGFWTPNSLNLTSYRKLRISWSQLVPTSNVGMLFEHSAAATWYPGGFAVTANEISSGQSYAYLSDRDMRTTGGSMVNAIRFSHSGGTANTTWDDMSLEINLDAPSNTAVMQMFQKNGILVSDYNSSYWGYTPTGPAPSSFGDYTFNIGARLGGSVFFTGYLDNITVEGTAVPEPGTVALLTLGLVGLLTYAWRKRR